MLSFGAFFNDNRTWMIALVVLAGIIGIAILIFLYRLLFGRRLHMAGGRTRQPRLGVVDAFDLDRQRQLVLVRRDNVEHLIMIGGPNDLVIESAFVRMMPTIGVPTGRDKEVGAGLAAPVAPMPAPFAAPSASVLSADAIESTASGMAPPVIAAGRDRAVPPLDLGEPLSGLVPETPERIAAPKPVPAAQVPAAPLIAAPPPLPFSEEVPAPISPEAERSAAEPEIVQAPAAPARPVPMPSRFSTTGVPRPAGSAPRLPLPQRQPGQATTFTPRTPTVGPRPMPSAPLTRGTSAASLRRDPPQPPLAATPVGIVPLAEQEAKPNETPHADVAPAAMPFEPVMAPVEGDARAAEPAPNRPSRDALPTTLDTLESLEEEMARLLGRPTAGSDKT